jgi:hypothetical protein
VGQAADRRGDLPALALFVCLPAMEVRATLVLGSSKRELESEYVVTTREAINLLDQNVEYDSAALVRGRSEPPTHRSRVPPV